MLDLHGRELNSALLFASHEGLCVPKTPKRAAMLMSSLHNTWETKEEAAELEKPEIVRRYNKTKGGVDSHDQLCHAYSVIRATLGWP